MKKFLWFLFTRFILLMISIIAIIVLGVLFYMEYELPDFAALNTIQLQVPLQIYSQDGKLIAEYGEQRRIPIPFSQIPQPLINAVLATEDQRYYQHSGIDLPGLVRAAIRLAVTGRKEQGGSTITMQVARSFYLNPHKTFGRKLREILFALKIDRTLTKQKILELYLNKIFLGNRAYGVEAAAEIYYGKPLKELSLDQYAMLAGLPKAPSSLNPITNPEAARKRRDHVLGRMLEQHYIDEKVYQQALKAPIAASYHAVKADLQAAYVAELARHQLEQMYGSSIYTDGFKVYTTIDSRLQKLANQSVHDSLIDYDQRHGYRGPEANWGNANLKHLMGWKKRLAKFNPINGLEPAVVLVVNDKNAIVLRSDGSLATIGWDNISWARKQLNADFLGRIPKTAHDVLHVGDLIRIMLQDKAWRLAQRPKAEAGLISLNPQNGQIKALVGGFDFQKSSFDRITDAQRQPGSSFKPFIYSGALDKGFTLATVINDAPIVVENTTDNSLWRPQNDTHQFYGPTRLRDALIHSRNLVSIRLLDLAGIPYTLKYVERFGFHAAQLPPTLSLALGTASVTPLQMANAYAIFANGGFKIEPYILDKILSPSGKILYSANPLAVCIDCKNIPANAIAPRVISAQNAFLITSALHDVIQFGTATAARELKRSDLAGKTGTTNNQVDAWFAGYNADLVAVAWVGFDQPQSLHEYGAKAALPMWMQYMQGALKNVPEHRLDQPSGIVSIKIDPMTGNRTAANDPTGIFEYFMEPFLPSEEDMNKPATNTKQSTAPEETGIY